MNVDIHTLSENLAGEVLRSICFRGYTFTPEKDFIELLSFENVLNGAERTKVEDLLYEDVPCSSYMNKELTITLILQHDSDTNLIIVTKDGYIYSNSDAKKDYGWKRTKVWDD